MLPWVVGWVFPVTEIGPGVQPCGVLLRFGEHNDYYEHPNCSPLFLLAFPTSFALNVCMRNGTKTRGCILSFINEKQITVVLLIPPTNLKNITL